MITDFINLAEAFIREGQALTSKADPARIAIDVQAVERGDRIGELRRIVGRDDYRHRQRTPPGIGSVYLRPAIAVEHGARRRPRRTNGRAPGRARECQSAEK